jgi:hypothetical protein
MNKNIFVLISVLLISSYVCAYPLEVSFPKDITLVDKQVSVEMYVFNSSSVAETITLTGHTTPFPISFSETQFRLNPNESNELTFEIVDPMCGINDLKAKKIRVLHDKSFIDDPTRILRALDFELRFKGFRLSHNTKKLREQYLKAPDREGLSISRVELTLKKLFSDSKRAPVAFEKIIKEKLYKIYTDSTIVKPNLGKKIAKSIELVNPESPQEVYLMGLKDNCVKAMLDSFKWRA